MSIRNSIERIPAPPLEVFQREYVFKQQPVIIVNLFEGQQINKISTIEQAENFLSELNLEIQEEFVTSVLNKFLLMNQRKKETYTLKEYLAFIEDNPLTKKMCTEYITPDQVRKLFEMPEYTQMNARDNDTYSLLFVGNAGNYAHLHFDGDYRQVLLYQVFGSKRVILIPPEAAKKLNPIGNFSTCFLENFSESDKEDFVSYVGGDDCILNPGEAIFMPACIWHYLEYIDTGMSFNIRFGRNRYTQFLGDSFHPNMYLQNIAAKMIDAEVVEREYLPVFWEIEAAYNQVYKSAFEKGKHLQKLFENIYQRICTNSIQSMYSFTNFDKLEESLLQSESERLYKAKLNSMQLLMGWNGVANLTMQNRM